MFNLHSFIKLLFNKKNNKKMSKIIKETIFALF